MAYEDYFSLRAKFQLFTENSIETKEEGQQMK